MQERKKLRINKTVTQIVLPAEKNDILIKWYNEDLRFQDEIPQTFKKGYVFLQNTMITAERVNDEEYKEMFKFYAKKLKTTYRQMENSYLTFLKSTERTTVYFEFDNNLLKIEIYCNDEKINNTTIDLNKTVPGANPPLEEVLMNFAKDTTKDFVHVYAYYCFVMLQTVLWYLATTTQTTKYKRENKERKTLYYEKKEIINPKRNKYITTPIYDMSKIRVKNTTGLIKRRKGWTYSHSFQVHGHYRHYANGKTIFIKPFIKGKGKEELVQTITISPKEN